MDNKDINRMLELAGQKPLQNEDKKTEKKPTNIKKEDSKTEKK